MAVSEIDGILTSDKWARKGAIRRPDLATTGRITGFGLRTL